MTPLHRASAIVAFLILAPVTVQAADEPEKVTSGSGPASQGSDSRLERRSSHIVGHIAFLKAELMITPGQEPAWSKVAQAMRDDVNDYDQTSKALPQGQTQPSAVESLSERAQFADLRAKGETRFLAAFRPLYDSFSPQQKAAADDLFATRDDE